MSYEYVEDHREYLLREFKNRSYRRPLYSQRAFARDIDVSPSTLTDFLKGRLALSAGRINQISKKINLNAHQVNHWIDLTKYKFSQNADEKIECQIKIRSRIESEKNAISADEFKIISEWQHFAFLELISMNAKKYSELKLSAKSLGLNLTEMKNCVDRLEKLNLILLNSSQVYEVNESTHVGNAAPSAAIRFFHSQILEKASIAIETQTVDERFNSSTMIGLPKSKVMAIIEQLKPLAVDILTPHTKDTSGADKDQLYCLSIQFFNLLNTKGK